MNNLKNIREIYGITQEEIAKAINVNRATISNWENQEDKKASSASLEKLSLFYGIGPEFFYDEALNDTVREMLVQNSKHQREIEKVSNGDDDGLGWLRPAEDTFQPVRRHVSGEDLEKCDGKDGRGASGGVL